MEPIILMAQGSIPAPAGEPLRSITDLSIGKVYPRACGGTWFVLILERLV